MSVSRMGKSKKEIAMQRQAEISMKVSLNEKEGQRLWICQSAAAVRRQASSGIGSVLVLTLKKIES